jgi:hypothetical protein
MRPSTKAVVIERCSNSDGVVIQAIPLVAADVTSVVIAFLKIDIPRR